jgi:predicted permease
MSGFLQHFSLASPLFLLVLLGYLLARSRRWPDSVGEALGRFAYAVALPAMLFRMMSGFSRLPAVDVRLQ